MKKYIMVGGIALAIAALGFGFGRYSAPVKIKEVEKIKTVTVKQQAKNTKEDRNVVTTVTEKPDGTKVTQTVDTTKVATDVKTDTASNSTTDKSKVTTFKKANWRVGGIAALDVKDNTFGAVKPIYGAYVERRILGPIFVGGMGLSNGTFGISLSFEF